MSFSRRSRTAPHPTPALLVLRPERRDWLPIIRAQFDTLFHHGALWANVKRAVTPEEALAAIAAFIPFPLRGEFERQPRTATEIAELHQCVTRMGTEYGEAWKRRMTIELIDEHRRV